MVEKVKYFLEETSRFVKRGFESLLFRWAILVENGDSIVDKRYLNIFVFISVLVKLTFRIS